MDRSIPENHYASYFPLAISVRCPVVLKHTSPIKVKVQAEGFRCLLRGGLLLQAEPPQSELKHRAATRLAARVEWKQSQDDKHEMTTVLHAATYSSKPKTNEWGFLKRCVFSIPLRFDLKETKKTTTCISLFRSLTRMNSAATYSTFVAELWNKKRIPPALSALTQLETPHLKADLILSYDLMSRAVSQTTVSGDDKIGPYNAPKINEVISSLCWCVTERRKEMWWLWDS